MRNYIILDFADSGANKCLAQIANKYENSINIAFYPYEVGSACNIVMYDKEYNILTNEYFSAAEEVNYMTLDADYFPPLSASIYIRYESTGYTSPYIEFSFLAGPKSYQYNMMLERDSDIKYRVFFRKTLSADELTNWMEGTEAEIAQTNTNVQNLSDTVQTAVSVNEALIEELTTNLTKYALRPRVTYDANRGWKWTDGTTDPETQEYTATPCFTATTQDKIRSYIDIEGNTITFLSVPLVTPADYSKITSAEAEYLVTLQNKKIYYKSLSDMTAGFTTVSPDNFDKTLTNEQVDMFAARRIKTSGTGTQVMRIRQSSSTVTENNDETTYHKIEVDLCEVGVIEYDEQRKQLKTTMKDSGNQNLETGIVVKPDNDNGGLGIYTKYAGNDKLLRAVGVYNTAADGESDTTLPVGGLILSLT